MNQSREGCSCLSSTDHLTGLCCSCTLYVLDQKPDRGIATSICMDVCWGMGALRGLLLLLQYFLRHLNGLLLPGRTHFVRVTKKIFPRSKQWEQLFQR